MNYTKKQRLAGVMTVGPKGQVVIPADVREDMNIKPGDHLMGLYSSEKKAIVFVSEKQAEEYIAQMTEHFTQFKEQLREAKQ